MPLQMNREVFITCAVTGSGATQDRSPHVPRSPKEIADSAIEAAKADRKSTRLNSSHSQQSRMPSSA